MHAPERSRQAGGPVIEKHAIPPFAALKAFEAVFRLGGVRKAAESLGVSHAIVSRHVAGLEDWLGVALVSRSGGRLELNELGRRYHAKVSAALGELSFASRELRPQEGGQTVRLHCIPGLSIQWLSRQLVDLEQLNPELVVDLRPTETPGDLHAHETDVNIVFRRDCDSPTEPSKWVRYFDLVRPEQVLVASATLAEKFAAQIRKPESLLTAPLLHGGNRADWHTWFRLNGVDAPETLPGVLCWHVHMAIAAAKMGQGVLLTNRFLLQEELAHGELVELAVPNSRRIELGTYVFSAREDRWCSRGIASLRQFLSSRMRALELVVASPLRMPQIT